MTIHGDCSGYTADSENIDPNSSGISNNPSNTCSESHISNSLRIGKRVSKSRKIINSVARGLVLESAPTMLIDEDLSTIQDISSDSGDSEYVSNEDNSDDSADYDDYDDLGDQSCVCQSCGAMMWYGERLARHCETESPKFSLCCMNGKVQLPKLKDPPTILSSLLFGRDRRSRNFQDNIRSYNMMFFFTSLGGKIQTVVNNSPGPYTFVLHGQNYHLLGSLLPEEGTTPKFAQLYIFDTENEVQNRIAAVRSGNNSNNLDPSIVSLIKDMIDVSNVLARSYRAARDRIATDGNRGVKLRLVKSRSTDGRTYNLPNASEIAALIVGDFDNQEGVRDIVVETQSKRLQRISELHPLYLPLQYPLIFPYGEDGYRDDIPLRESSSNSSQKRRCVSMREWFAYRMQKRNGESQVLLNSKKLFQQFQVDGFSMIESQRLNFIRFNQDKLRVDMYKGLQEMIVKGDGEGTSAGMRIVLPSTFTNGPRYMFNNFMDALQICNWIGFPSLFITITCNPKWPEIQRVLRDTNLRPEDRPDILCRVFKMKLDSLISDFKKGHIFGRIRSYVCTIEFQKRGLPHAHILLWLHNDDKPKCSEDIGRIICAEIPDKTCDRKMYKLVKKYMIHGPCGHANMNSPCMKDGICTKRFPKRFVQRTEADDEGYHSYRRREDGRTVTKKKILLDNGYVVPYNRALLLKYRAHINIELCNQNKSIKYLFKYVNKGNDRVTAAFYQSRNTNDGEQIRDEIKIYYDCRYLSACEASWRLFGFDIHYRDPPVIRLSFHLPDSQMVVYHENQHLQNVVNRPSAKQSMFLAWFEANKRFPEARTIKYADFPQHFVYSNESMSWEPRKKRFSIGRLNNVPPGKGEDYYLRLLLNIQAGCTSYEELRTVNMKVYDTFRNACYVLGLLQDDKEYIDGIKEVSRWASTYCTRLLFAILLLANNLSRLEYVWEKCWSELSDDINYRHRKRHNNPALTLSDDDLKNYALIEIEKILQSNGKSLRNYAPMHVPIHTMLDDTENRLILDELDYDVSEMRVELQKLLSSITPDQKKVYDTIMNAVSENSGGMFFLYGHGGTGKTFIWNTLSAAVRSEKGIVINVASSGIASLLLPGGRTTHSRFGLPIIVHESSTCSIKQQSPQAELLIEAKLIIWDEAPMMHRFCFEALDRTMRSILNSEKPFGGKVIVLGGDFRQILPVVLKASRQDIVHATINSSPLWRECRVMRLHKNMRLQLNSSSSNEDEIREFAEWILRIGNGEAGDYNDGEASIEIPEDMLIRESEDAFSELLQFVYPDLLNNIANPDFFQGRAILGPTNESVIYVNDYLSSLIEEEEKVYLSSDSLCMDEAGSEINAEIYSTEFLNTISCSGLPPHELKLKKRVPVMLIRNIDQARGLCNGTRLQVERLGMHVISCKVLSGKNVGDMVFIPRMTLIPSNSTLPVKFQRRQYPVIISFAMTINKSQGQTLSHVGLYLPRPVFSHGQLYVALSRVKSRSGIKIFIKGESGELSSVTSNVVYKEVFERI